MGDGGDVVKVSYNRDSTLREDRVDVHYREESAQIEIIRNFFTS